MRYLHFLFLVFLTGAPALKAQVTFPTNGAPSPVHTVFALVHAHLVDDIREIKDGTLLVQDKVILAAGAGIAIPENAVIIDLKGKYIYPSFIELNSSYGMPSVSYERRQQPGPQMESSLKGAYGWNMALRTTLRAHELFRHDQEAADDWRKAGFGAVMTFAHDGIVRGSAAFVLLNSSRREHESILTEKAGACYSFEKGSSPQDYPSSLTGAIALLRQSFYDANWYALQKTKEEFNISLAEFKQLQELVPFFETHDKANVLRAARLASEFKLPFIIKGGGNEYQRIDEIKQSCARLILPLNFPEAMDVEDPFVAQNINVAEMKHWEMAPANPAFLEQAGVVFAMSAGDLKDRSRFLPNLRKAVQHGLSEKTALRALTTIPATFLNLQNKIGTLQKGMVANFMVTTRSIFDSECLLVENWSGGSRYSYADAEVADVRGTYDLQINNKKYELLFSGDLFHPQGFILSDTTKKGIGLQLNGRQIAFAFSKDSTTQIRANGSFLVGEKIAEGRAQMGDGNWCAFTLRLKKPAEENPSISPVIKKIETGSVWYPFAAFGQTLVTDPTSFQERFLKSRSNSPGLLIRHVNVWTNLQDSVLRDFDVLVTGTKISRVAKNIPLPVGYTVIEGEGKHLTCGIIDEHSHIALSGGVNEGAEASSAEVRMGDVINPEDINIYRQLSGGVTSAQLLHGSANPIGGQSALIKLRWGLGSEEMKIAGADGFIKFALGENVKQSNWGDLNVVRFPQSRMGVEQVYRDFFTRALEYDRLQKDALKNKKEPFNFRRDLELETLAEILNSKRFITCHSYVQSEINMLMHVADSFGFRVNTFTHILEGYKVADKMKQHGVCASTFSDWWAYKNEVLDAIPYNAALLTKAGVVTAINSDDAEMARRLNQEAAKSIKYGQMTEAEALKLVTLNPAKMLHLDKELGTIESGKSADLVLWSGHPLSVYSKAEKTIIDGMIYYSREQDLVLRTQVQQERARLITKLLAEKQKGLPVTKRSSKPQQLYHCNTIEGVSETLTGQR